ncbi:membrane protein CcdC involved in cytochrome C biogenesis [Alkalihalobacillus xiaoxiensis]|uniref:Membrane protein CcdC involved in cytochrome C biogenesis n=1 Tax=Shouchella xiaoxiensis TaxID=766895 RepID=A0ABS2SS84_9BACI|nr:cytochrome c biogenesis protein CcdC [Shouchella xiaoxiensis]MBM7838368.1 membrane protein CcdC involved in cytochrome C biogenesis [Shouchella xiaoxiensis]
MDDTSWIYIVIPTVMAFLMGTVALVIRMRASKKPTSAKRIMIPPLAMSTGFLMFLYEPTRPSAFHVMEALAAGLLFSILLIYTSKFEVKNGDIYLKRSKAFAFILIGLLLVRIVLRLLVGQDINPVELSGMFFLLAFGMLLPWRVAMLVKYTKMKQDTYKSSITPSK